MTYRDETETIRVQLEEAQRKLAMMEAAQAPREVIVWRENGRAADWVHNAVSFSFGAAVLLGVAVGAALANGLARLGAAVGALALASLACGLYVWWRSLPRELRAP